MSKKFYAFFDLDGTLVSRDSYLPYLFGWLRHQPQNIWRVILLPWSILIYIVARKHRSYIKTKFLKAFMTGARRPEVDRYSKDFWKSHLKKYQVKRIIEKIQQYHEDGVPVYIVTASYEFYAQMLQHFLPIDIALGTATKWHNDCIQGDLIGNICRGSEKIKRIENAIGKPITEITYHAFSDNDSDMGLLENAAYSIKINKDRFDVSKDEIHLSENI